MDHTGVERTRAPQGSRPILRDLLLGVCLGGVCAAMVWRFYPGPWQEPEVTAVALAEQRREALQQQARQQAGAAAATVTAPPAAPGSACELEPMIPPGASGDGQAVLGHPFPADPRAKAEVFVRAAQAATAGHRPRDAEMALIAACRESERAAPGPTVPLARVLGMLGDRYAAAAADPSHPALLREQILARARHVRALSAASYATALGPDASRTREARRRLADLDRDVMSAASADGPREPPPASVPAVAAPARETVRVTESDPELGQLASDLARLRAQAEAVSDDIAGLARRAEIAQAQRDRCEDKACLRRWYEMRRRQLLAEF